MCEWNQKGEGENHRKIGTGSRLLLLLLILFWLRLMMVMMHFFVPSQPHRYRTATASARREGEIPRLSLHNASFDAAPERRSTHLVSHAAAAVRHVMLW